MKYNPDKHNRKSIRLKGYDYSSAGAYLVTICVKNRECLFGKIQNGKMILNDFGNIIDYHWKNIPSHFQNVVLDQFIVMPNHLHGILRLRDDDGKTSHPEYAVTVGAKHSWQHRPALKKLVARNASPLLKVKKKRTNNKCHLNLRMNLTSVTFPKRRKDWGR